MPIPTYAPPRMISPWMSPFVHWGWIQPEEAPVPVTALGDAVSMKLQNEWPWYWVLYRGFSERVYEQNNYDENGVEYSYVRYHHKYHPDLGYWAEVQWGRNAPPWITGWTEEPLIEVEEWGISFEEHNLPAGWGPIEHEKTQIISQWVCRPIKPNLLSPPKEVQIRWNFRHWAMGMYFGDALMLPYSDPRHPTGVISYVEIYIIPGQGTVVIPNIGMNWEFHGVSFFTETTVYAGPPLMWWFENND